MTRRVLKGQTKSEKKKHYWVLFWILLSVLYMATRFCLASSPNYICGEVILKLHQSYSIFDMSDLKSQVYDWARGWP